MLTLTLSVGGTGCKLSESPLTYMYVLRFPTGAWHQLHLLSYCTNTLWQEGGGLALSMLEWPPFLHQIHTWTQDIIIIHVIIIRILLINPSSWEVQSWNWPEFYTQSLSQKSLRAIQQSEDPKSPLGVTQYSPIIHNSTLKGHIGVTPNQLVVYDTCRYTWSL